MKGKQRCKILKEIRRQIAENNDIEYITSECKHQGDCAGTCPKCESEVRYLERELEKRARLGKAVTVAGLAVTITATTMSTVACDLPWEERELGGEPMEYETTDGLMMAPEDEKENVEMMGDPAPPTVYLPEFEQFSHLLDDTAALYDFLLAFCRDNGSLSGEATYDAMSYNDWSWSHTEQSGDAHVEYFIVRVERDPQTDEEKRTVVGLVYTPTENADPEELGAYLWTAVVVETLTVAEIQGDVPMP